MEEEKKEKTLQECVMEKVENKINEIIDVEGVNRENVDYLGKLVDIHKDFKNEDYWKIKEEVKYMYRGEYGNYPIYEGGRRRDSRGRYMDGSSYGRRGVPSTGRGRTRYRGHEMLDDMYEAYGDYMEGADEYGTYGDQESMQKIEIMADSLMDFVEHLKHEAKTPEEKQLIERKLKELGRM